MTNKSKVSLGYILHPKDKSLEVNAILEYGEAGIFLDLHIDLGKEQQQILSGVFNGIGEVTLVGCYHYKSESGYGGNFFKMKAMHLFLGIHVTKVDELLFSRVSVDFPILWKWLNIRIIKYDIEYKITYNYPDDIVLYENGNYKISITFSLTHRNNYSEGIFNLKEAALVKIESVRDKLSLWELLEIIKQVKKFILLLTNSIPISESITFFSHDFFYNDSDEESPKLKPIQYYSELPEVNQSFWNPDIRFSLIKDKIQTIFNVWMTNKDIENSVDLIFEKKFNSNLSDENYFLNTCFSIETFHRRFKNRTKYCNAEFNNIKYQILQSISDKRIYKFIEDILKYSNEPSFRSRLKDIKNDFNEILSDDEDVNTYIGRIVDTRNYLVHRGDSTGTFLEHDLLVAAKYLEVIIKVNIYRILKVDEKIIKDILLSFKRNTTMMNNFH